VPETVSVYKARGNHKPVTIIKGATVVIYDDGTTVVTKSGKVTTIHVKHPRTTVHKTASKTKTAKPSPPASRKTAK
jgi:hypothetical protein